MRSAPPLAGIGLRAPHYREILESQPDVGWLEVHSENYFGRGGQPLYYLERMRERYPLSLHGVGLSLGSADGLRRSHLMQLKALAERFEPTLVSDHLCWGAIGVRHLNDLLPLPYTDEALDLVCANVAEARDFLRREILVENVSSYLQFSASRIPEWAASSARSPRNRQLRPGCLSEQAGAVECTGGPHVARRSLRPVNKALGAREVCVITGLDTGHIR